MGHGSWLTNESVDIILSFREGQNEKFRRNLENLTSKNYENMCFRQFRDLRQTYTSSHTKFFIGRDIKALTHLPPRA